MRNFIIFGDVWHFIALVIGGVANRLKIHLLASEQTEVANGHWIKAVAALHACWRKHAKTGAALFSKTVFLLIISGKINEKCIEFGDQESKYFDIAGR